jgi:hypothetical protein
MQISLKVHGDINIVGVVALVIHSIVGLNFVRTAQHCAPTLSSTVEDIFGMYIAQNIFPKIKTSPQWNQYDYLRDMYSRLKYD